MANPVAWYIQNVYRHEPLRSCSLDSPAFRLLDLWPGDEEANLCGTLQEHDVASGATPIYECLSYRWEGKDESKSIMIDGRRLEIWGNLWTFLRTIRHRSRTLTIWADAICVDQENRMERSQQVGLMGEIYGHAERVHVWLGPADRGSTELFVWANRAHKAPIDGRVPDFAQKAVWHLSRRDYWSRAWIVQECVVARSITVHCGCAKIDWEVLDNMLNAVLGGIGREDGTSDLDSKDDHAVGSTGESSMSTSTEEPSESANSFLETLRGARRDLDPQNMLQSSPLGRRNSSHRESIDATQMPFLHYIRRFSGTACSDPLDKIYAFVNLTPRIHARLSLQQRQQYASTLVHTLRTAPKGHHQPLNKFTQYKAIRPDYSRSFRDAAMELAYVQGPGNMVQAWELIASAFSKELDPFRHTRFYQIPMPPDPPTAETLALLYGPIARCTYLELSDLEVARSYHKEKELDDACKAWVVSEARLASAQAVQAISPDGRDLPFLIFLDEDAAGASSAIEPWRGRWGRQTSAVFFAGSSGHYLANLGSNFLVRVRSWAQLLDRRKDDASRQAFNEAFLPFWRWPSRPYNIPSKQLWDDVLGLQDAWSRVTLLDVLWGYLWEQGAKEAWTQAHDTGYVDVPYGTQAFRPWYDY